MFSFNGLLLYGGGFASAGHHWMCTHRDAACGSSEFVATVRNLPLGEVGLGWAAADSQGSSYTSTRREAIVPKKCSELRALEVFGKSQDSQLGSQVGEAYDVRSRFANQCEMTARFTPLGSAVTYSPPPANFPLERGKSPTPPAQLAGANCSDGSWLPGT